ncbi:regulator of G-protein signaling 4-like protein [Lates japonicus]|uniref:Regulator of G-protein signaling 4-like protein n=1 Tax=Lates japonicus TaxID=270547 RepID=A0AAD3R4G1_LATJO|nr:regulator of G-protein signaling 4-like protein [Lates japonicus]
MCKGLATLPATCLKSAKDIKHKISFLLQKPEPQAADQKQMKEKNAVTAATAAAAKRVPTATEVKKWRESFSHVMNSDSKCYFVVSHPQKLKLNWNRANEAVLKSRASPKDFVSY